MRRFDEWWAEHRAFILARIEDWSPKQMMRTAYDSALPEWQPIETAPKGKYSESRDDDEWVEPPKILLSTPEGVVIACWDYYYDGSVGGHGYCGNDSAWVTDEGELVEDACDTPMYWMPIPQPPKI